MFNTIFYLDSSSGFHIEASRGRSRQEWAYYEPQAAHQIGVTDYAPT